VRSIAARQSMKILSKPRLTFCFMASNRCKF